MRLQYCDWEHCDKYCDDGTQFYDLKTLLWSTRCNGRKGKSRILLVFLRKFVLNFDGCVYHIVIGNTVINTVMMKLNTTILDILLWSTCCQGRKEKMRNLHVSFLGRVFILVVSENKLVSLCNQCRHRQSPTLKENTVSVGRKLTLHDVLIWVYIVESLLASAHLRIKEISHWSTNGHALNVSQQQVKNQPLSNITNGRIVYKHLKKGKLKHLRSAKETMTKFVRRRKHFKHICLSKESDFFNGKQMPTMFFCFSLSISTNICEMCTNQTHKDVSVKPESCSITWQNMETQIRTTVMYSNQNICTEERPKVERRKYLQSDRVVHRNKIKYQCIDILLQRQALSNTIREISEEIMLSSKAEHKMLHQYGIDIHQNLQIYPVQQFSLEQAFLACGEGGQIITNPEVFFSNYFTRLSSYSNFPSESAPSTIKLSKAGFYATGNVDETACFHCGCRYSRWNPSEDPVQIHEDIFPECEFIQEIYANEGHSRRISSHTKNGILCSEETEMHSRRDQTKDSFTVYGDEHLFRNTNIVNKDSVNDRSTSHCDNIPMLNRIEDFQQEKHQHESMPSITSISHGFQNISLDNAPSTMSIHVSSKPSIASASCNSCFEKVQPNDNSDQQEKGSYLATNGDTSVHGNWNKTHQHFKNPLFPQYTALPVRISSFAKWPTHVKQTAKEMALAGFFYKGYGDAVACYWCGVCVVSWEEEDEPCIEHVKWQPLCPYTIKSKGQEFVDLVLEQQGRQLYQGHRSIDDYNVAEQTLSSKCAAENVNYTKLKEMGFDQRKIDIAACKASRQKVNPTEEEILELLLNDDSQRENTETIPRTAMSFKREEEPWNVTPKYKYATSANSSEERDHLNRIERLVCKICLAEEVKVTFLPCGHLVCCMECSGMVNKCPICRAPIKKRVKSFIS